jgi:hypothetical protein
MFYQKEKGHRFYTYGPFRIVFDRIAGISHGADAVSRTSATNPRQILHFPAAESCRSYCRIDVGRSSRMRAAVLWAHLFSNTFKNATPVDFVATRKFPLITQSSKKI